MNDSVETNVLPAPIEEAKSSVTLPETRAVPAPKRDFWRRTSWYKVGLFGVSLFLFMLAITLMKEGARPLAPLVRDSFRVSNAINSLGFGWLFAYVIMSGSPVAAASLAFLEADVINELATFTMITGSRLGASFIVLFIGFVYVLRGRDRATSLGMGLLSFMVTGSLHVVGLFVGILFLRSEIVRAWQLPGGMLLGSAVDALTGPIVGLMMGGLPEWGVFVVGLGIILVSFNLFDRCLPQMTLKESQFGRVSRLVFRPWVMFLLGAAITLMSMSVSVSLSILVPLSARGFVRRENVIPYIMGANVTTFVDTLLASLLIANPLAFTVVLAEMLSIAVVSILLLVTVYGRYERAMLSFVGWTTADNRHLALFMFVILVTPLLMLVW